MKVCFVCEGSYPYVSGGVSSWVSMLCNAFSDIEFTIWSIATNKKDMNQYKYTLPDNITKVETVYIGEMEYQPRRGTPKLSQRDKAALRMLMTVPHDQIDWAMAVSFIATHRAHLPQIIMGKLFYEFCLEIYKDRNMNVTFHDFIWNMRGMYLPLMAALSGSLPEADIYHSVSTGYAGILASSASYIYDKPFILSEHGIYTREREEDIIRAEWVDGDYKDIWIDFFNKLSAVSYYRADVVTTLFETNKTLQIELGCPEEKITVIPNGIDFDAFYRPVPETFPQKDHFDIGTILRIVPIKDVKTMLVAFFQIKDAIHNARLHIFGNYDEDPEYYRECVSLKESLGLKDVIFYGQVNVREHVGEMDLLLLTSISEGQPLSVLEGMAAGKPHVCTNVGDCRGLLYGEDDGIGAAGLIVPVMNGEEIAKKVIELYHSKELMLEMGRNAQRRAEKFYKKEHCLEKFRQLYDTVGKAGER